MKKFLNFTGTTTFPLKNSLNSFFLRQKKHESHEKKENFLSQELQKQVFVKKFSYLTKDFLANCAATLKNQMSFLCTLSGGQDSILSFFLLLHSYKKDYLQIVYCHHFWQIKNFFSTRFVFQISCLMKVPYTLILPQTFFPTENESRSWRKKNFGRVSQREHFLTTLTGHTETDILEKDLHNIFRGTSPAGLSDLKFLKCKNKVVFFFPSINLNTSFCCTFDKSKQVSQELVFQKGNRCTKSWYNFHPKLQILAANSTKYSERKNFQFSKLLKKSTELPYLSINPVNRQYSQVIQKKHQEIIFFFKIENFERDFLVKKFRKKNCFSQKQNIFSFFDSKKDLVNSRINPTFKQKKSYSFCFSTESINLPVALQKPLNKTTRFSVSRLVNLYKFPVIIDITNFSSRFSRNKIRHQLIPFVRSLVHSNVEFLITNFFKMVNAEHEDREKDVEQVYFLLKCLKRNFGKKKIPSVDTASFFVSKKTKQGFFEVPIIYESNSAKLLIKRISPTESRSFIQKLFFKYKNLNLNYSQILKLENFSIE